MARYARDFMGIPADLEHSRGADPNYRGGYYHGMRVRGGPSQAPYAWHRRTHESDLGGEGGFYGRFGRSGSYDADYGRGYAGRRSLPADYDWELHGGGGVRPHAQYGPRFRDGGGHPIDRDTHPRFRYANRGMSEGGYTVPWARGPMPGAR